MTSSRKRLRSWLTRAAVCVGLVGVLSDASAGSLNEAANAVTELDVKKGQKLLEGMSGDSKGLSIERARLAIYLGDCETANAILESPSLATEPIARSLTEVARGCTGATAGGLIVEDKQHGIWVRLQDGEDEALVPYLIHVAARARDAIAKDLGVELPRPLRIDIVRDLFSLAAVTGLPLTAAETTGTVAVARWGRVTMLSPRAASLGYPWEDTLAHEITHLALTRASRDRAPLWLQEGIAKREETRWREAQPFDRPKQYEELAKRASLSGQSVGIQNLGQSIAMLPTPQAASIAFAEVTSFMSYWIELHGEADLQLLLADLKGIGRRDADAAMLSVTGYPLRYWDKHWQRYIDGLPAPEEEKALSPLQAAEARKRSREVVRDVRLGDLLFHRGHAAGAAAVFGDAYGNAPEDPSVRARLARSWIALGEPDRAWPLVEKAKDVSAAHAHWLALKGRRELERGDDAAAKKAFELGISIDPLSETVACEGQWTPRKEPGALPAGHPTPAATGSEAPAASASAQPIPTVVEVTWPIDATRRKLCEAARRFRRD